MEQLPIYRKALIRRFFTIFLPLVGIVILLSWAIYYFQHIKIQREILIAQESNMLDMQKKYVQKTMQSIISDIHVIEADLDLNDLINQKKQKNASNFSGVFLSFSKYKGIYDQVRILDNTGMELIRVDLRGNLPYLVPDEKLQFKGKRYYFKDIHKLKKGEIFISPFDLNIENGKIEQPLKPMIRFGMPIFGQDGEKQGVLILNYLGKRLFDDLNKLSFRSPAHLLLLNAESYWLKGRYPEDEWGFMFEDCYQRKFGLRYPTIWRQILHNVDGQIFNKDGLFTFNKVYPLKEGIKSSSGSPKPFQESTRALSSDEYYWVIISHIFPNELHQKGDYFLIILIIIDWIFLCLLGCILWHLIVANARRRLAEDALKKANKDLEETVEQRTEELSKTNIALKKEVEEHHKVNAEKSKIESQLQQAQKMEAIGTLAGGIAHDFNNILSVILGYGEMVQEQLQDGSHAQKAQQEVLKAGIRAKGLVQQILAFSRQNKTEQRPIQIHLIIKEALKMLRASIPTTIEIRQDIDSASGAVLADPTQIHQIIMNLCTNAYQAMNKTGGVLAITMHTVQIDEDDTKVNNLDLTPGVYVMLDVSDTGHGMHKNTLAKIFDPYFSTKKKGEGTGLGLSVVYGIVQSYGGYISVYSELNKGTSFRVYLPKINSESKADDTITNEPYPGGAERILIVDDEDAIVKMEKQMLESLGYQVKSFSNSKEAWQVFQDTPERFDLIITDMTMPGITGAELSQRVRNIRHDIPIILCTGFSELMDQEKASTLGIKKFLMKPVLKRDLAVTVRHVLDEETVKNAEHND